MLSAKPSTVGGGPNNLTGGAANKKIVLSSTTTSGAGAGTTSSAQQNRTLAAAGTTGATASNIKAVDPINVGPASTATTSQVLGGAKKKGTDPVKMGYLQQKLQEQKQKMKERAAAAAAAAAAETNGAAGAPTATAPGAGHQGLQPQTLPPTPGIASSASSASSSGNAPPAGGHQQQHLPAPPSGIASAVPSGSGAASTSGGSANVKDLDQEPTPQQPSPSEGSTGGGDLAAVSLPGVLGTSTDPGGGQLTTSSSGPGRLEFLRSKLVHARKKKAAEQAAAQAALSAQSSPAVESSDGGGAGPGSSEENHSLVPRAGDGLVDQLEDKNSSSNQHTSSSSSSSNKNESPGGTSSSLEDAAFLLPNGDRSTNRVQLGADHQSHTGVLEVPPGAAGGEEVRSTTSIGAPNGGGAPVAGSRLAPGGLQQPASGAVSKKDEVDAGILGTAAHAAKAATSKKTILLNKRSAAEQANTAGDAEHDDGLAGPALKKKKTLVLRRKKGTTEQGVPVSEIPAKKQKSKDGKSAGTTTTGGAAAPPGSTATGAKVVDKEVNSKLNTKDLREPEHERQGPSPTLMSSNVLDHSLSTPGGLVDVTLLQHPITSTTSTRTPAVLTLEAAAAGVKKDSKQMEQKQDQRPGAVDNSSSAQPAERTCVKPVSRTLVPETPPSRAPGRQHAQASLAASAREVASDHGPTSVLFLPAPRDSLEVNGRTTTRNSRKNEAKPSSVVEPARNTSSSSAPPASASAVSVVRLNSDSTQSTAASGQHKTIKQDGDGELHEAVKTATSNSTSSAAPASASRPTSRPEQVAQPHQSQTQLQPSSSPHQHPSSSSSSTTSSIGVPTSTMEVEQGYSAGASSSSSSAGGGTTVGMRRQDHLRQKLQELKQKRGGILSYGSVRVEIVRVEIICNAENATQKVTLLQRTHGRQIIVLARVKSWTAN